MLLIKVPIGQTSHLKQHFCIPICSLKYPGRHSGEHIEVGTCTYKYFLNVEIFCRIYLCWKIKAWFSVESPFIHVQFCAQIFTKSHPNHNYISAFFILKVTTYLSLCVPINFGVVDEKSTQFRKMVKANFLRITSVIPKYYRIGSKLWVTIFIKFNCLI